MRFQQLHLKIFYSIQPKMAVKHTTIAISIYFSTKKYIL